jgi:15-cis-phytoene synthase
MTAYLPNTWEHHLIMLAEQAQHTRPEPSLLDANLEHLSRADRHCAELTRQNSKTFFLASALLPPEKRRAARALYALCRVSDNIVDCPEPERDPLTTLAEWRTRVAEADRQSDDPVLAAWAQARETFHIPTGYVDQLIDGVGRDLTKQRYETFASLAEYAYGVASTVGLMAMHIVGYSGADAIPYAVRLGVALQMTNILRDVAEDLRFGRVYLPQDELAAFGLDDAFLERGQVTDAWRAFMHFQIERTRRLYSESWAGIAKLDSDGRFAIAAAGKLYDAILDDIVAHDYDVFSRRAHIGAAGKLARLPKIWWMSRARVD